LELLGPGNEIGHVDLIDWVNYLRHARIFNPRFRCVLWLEGGIANLLVLLQLLYLLGAADSTAEREYSASPWVIMGRWMCNAEWTVDSITVLQWHDTKIVAAMARIAHVVRPEATEERYGAAIHALPVDLDVTVGGASGRSSTNVLQEAVLTQKVLLLLSFLGFLGHFLLAIDEAAKVGLLALVALIESAAV
jgi:hypothetical protein